MEISHLNSENAHGLEEVDVLKTLLCHGSVFEDVSSEFQDLFEETPRVYEKS